MANVNNGKKMFLDIREGFTLTAEALPFIFQVTGPCGELKKKRDDNGNEYVDSTADGKPKYKATGVILQLDREGIPKPLFNGYLSTLEPLTGANRLGAVNLYKPAPGTTIRFNKYGDTTVLVADKLVVLTAQELEDITAYQDSVEGLDSSDSVSVVDDMVEDIPGINLPKK